MNAVLTKNLKGKGWVPIKSIGGWFTESGTREALATIKTKHKQVGVCGCCGLSTRIEPTHPVCIHYSQPIAWLVRQI